MDDMQRRRPRVVGPQVARLKLTREERFLIARIDGELSVEELVTATGLPPERLEHLVSKLAFDGAVDLGPELDPPTPLPRISALPRPLPPPAPPPPPPPAPPLPDAELDEAVEDVALEPEAADESEPAEAAAELDEAAPEDEASGAIAERNYRQVYALRWGEHPVDVRAAAAPDVRGADLFALCFDPDPGVIARVIENATIGLDHVRLIAQYHRTGTGLEIVSRRAEWLRDLLVERRLLRNPMLGDVVLGRVMNPKRLLPTYKTAIDRDVPEGTRVKTRAFLRKKWQTAPPEERAELLQRTEGRCLILMTGCTFDAKTTGILCGRPINSVMFVQSLAKFGAAPPGLLAHLVKQPFVRKNAPLKKMLLAHPNMPGDVKRQS